MSTYERLHRAWMDYIDCMGTEPTYTLLQLEQAMRLAIHRESNL